jgi:ppGpp synthetase/RelA/SpoT-type nucleotidyltranferase
MRRNRDEIERQVNLFRQCRESYVRYADTLGTILRRIVRDISTEGIVQTRAKTITSYAEKIQRPGKAQQYGDNPIENLTDLCGGRIILPTLDHVKACCRLVEENFSIQWEDSEDKLELLAVSEFGYLSNHYIVQIDPESSYASDLDLPEEVLALKAEIQVRTFLQHAWTVIHHDYIYKPHFKIPENLHRQFYRIAAILEDADNEFVSALGSLKVYEENYGAYMTAQEINDQIDRLILVYENAPDKSQEADLVLRIAKLARSVARWDISTHVLSGLVDSQNAAVLRELGIAQYKAHSSNPEGAEYKKGQQYLEKAIALDPADTDALTSLGGSWKGTDLEKALHYYGLAFDINSDDPYTALNFFIARLILDENTGAIQSSKPVIRNLINISKRQISYGINVPWAHFNHGLFSLLTGNLDESLNNYLLGARFCTAQWMISTHLNDLDGLSVVDSDLPALRLVRHLMLLFLAARFGDGDATRRLKKDFGIKEKNLATPLVVVAGSTDSAKEELGDFLRDSLIGAFRSFEGVIISGSTVAGVCSLVGDVQKKYPKSIRALGYIPKELPANVEVDKRFSAIHRTSGSGFSVLEALQYWADIVLNQIGPGDVKLLGIGGGAISAFEYRLALALGAQVGILSKSTGSASELLRESIWKECNLTVVENTAAGISDFLTGDEM